jgi:hypothetical protein
MRKRKIRAPKWQLPLFSFVDAVSQKKQAARKNIKIRRVMTASLMRPHVIIRVGIFLSPIDRLRYASTCVDAKQAILSRNKLWAHVNTAELGLSPESGEGLVCAALKSCIRGSSSLEVRLPHLTNTILEIVAQRSSNLTHLSLHGSSLFVPTRLGFGLLMILNNVPRMCSFAIVGGTVSARILAGISTKCPSLEQLSFVETTESGIEEDQADDDGQITPEHVKHLCACEQLRRIDITQRRNILMNRKAIAMLAASQQKLLRVTLNGCAVDDDTLMALTAHCPSLETLQCVRSCHTNPLTQTGIQAVLEGCAHLHCLQVGNLQESVLEKAHEVSYQGGQNGNHHRQWKGRREELIAWTCAGKGRTASGLSLAAAGEPTVHINAICRFTAREVSAVMFATCPVSTTVACMLPLVAGVRSDLFECLAVHATRCPLWA